jgi:hypothetical protein
MSMVIPDAVGPFDDEGLDVSVTDVAGPPSGDLFGVEPPHPPAAAPPDRPDVRHEVVKALRENVAALSGERVVALPGLEPDPPCHPYDLQQYPRVVNGIVVPAISVKTGWLDDLGIRRRAAPEYIPASSVNTVRPTVGSVVAYLRTGKPVVVWVGDSTAERDRALVAVLSGLGRR